LFLSLQVGTNTRTFRDDWPIETNNVLDQLHVTTEKVGKQHIGYSLCISQSIAREFIEHAKATTKRISDLELKVVPCPLSPLSLPSHLSAYTQIQSSVEEIAKNTKIWKKKYGKYIRLVQDAEVSIIARDAAIREYAEKITNTTEEGFFNRSITMVLISSLYP
jgi:hypothetical protein